MDSCKLVIKDEVNIKLEGLSLEIRKKLANSFKYELGYAKYHPAYKLGRWDGTISLFGLGGNGYLSQLPRILEILKNNNVDITEIEDLRKPVDLVFTKIKEDYWEEKCWPDGHQLQGQPIRLREDQVAVINRFLENPQCLQEIATGFGKCLAGETLIDIEVDADSSFGNFIKNSSTILSIFDLATYIEEYKQLKLKNNEEVLINDLNIKISTPTGSSTINYIIKKYNLPILKITLSNGYVFKAATKHIVFKQGKAVYLSELKIGDILDHKSLKKIFITSISHSNNEDCYDIAIESPHVYYDANGIAHHNTITTATLAKLCEVHGRTITIVPNKSLVEQTEEDFINVDLDVGVYYGDRKELNKTHTICTWQSLNILDKKTKNNEIYNESLTLTEFLEGVSCVMVDECFEGNVLITTPMGQIPIKDLKTGDKVINLCENTKKYKEDTIIKVHKNLTHSQNEKMLELEFDNNIKIQVTANHKFLTNKGWLRADELTENVDIIDISTYV